MVEEELTPEEEQELTELFGEKGYGYPTLEEKQNIYAYFKKVIAMPFNIKTANINKDEMGMIQLPVRSLLGLSLYCKSMGMSGFSHYFKNEAQIILGSSLSFEGFLDKLAVTQKKESEIKTRRLSQPKRGFFGKKKRPEEEMVLY